MNAMVDKQCAEYVHPQKTLPGSQTKRKIKTEQKQNKQNRKRTNRKHTLHGTESPLNLIYATHKSSFDLHQAFTSLFSL